MTDDPMPSPPRPDRSGRGLRIALVMSLALNLLVIGAVAGAFVGGKPDGERRGARSDAVAPYTRAFSDDQRRALRRDLADAMGGRSGLAERRDALSEDYRAALSVLRSEPFEAARLDAILERQTQRSETRRAAGRAVLSAHIAAMTPSERQAFADRLEESIARFAERRRRWHD